MNPLLEAQRSLLAYCRELTLMLKQSLLAYFSVSPPQEKKDYFDELKKYSEELDLLEAFYDSENDMALAKQLHNQCVLLGNEHFQDNEEDQLRLLAKIFQLLAQISATFQR